MNYSLEENNLSGTLSSVPIFPTAPESSSRLTGSVKMADCIRVPLLLLLMCIFLFVHPIQAQNKAISRLIAGVDKMQNPVGGPGPAVGNPGVDERNQGAGASLSRRRSTGWKLAEEAVCRDDLTRLCPKHSWNNNLAVLECLQDRKEVYSREW